MKKRRQENAAQIELGCNQVFVQVVHGIIKKPQVKKKNQPYIPNMIQ